MTLKKRMIAVLAAGALTASAIPALALENEFHGMFKAMGYYTNTFNGSTSKGTFGKDHASTSNYFEQRARILYMAKANDDLKLVTQFELDSRFGGANYSTSATAVGYKGITWGNDSGQLDADSITLETKWVYLDFNEPWFKTNFKVGLHGWKDAYQSLFLLADMTGIYATKKFGDFTGSLGWYRYYDAGQFVASTSQYAGRMNADLVVADANYNFSKDARLGLTYYLVDNNNSNSSAFPAGSPGAASATAPRAGLINMFGLNGTFKFEGSTLEPFFAYQVGDYPNGKGDLSAYLAGVVAKAKLPMGAFNFNLIYMSGDTHAANASFNGDYKGFQTIIPNTTYFNAANMWLLVRNKDAVNSSSSILNNDMTVGSRGQLGIYAGYEGNVDKFFYSANVGYASTSEQRVNSGVKENSSIGTEVNATIGYKLYDSLSVSLSGAWCFLGNGMKNPTSAGGISGFTGGGGADDPWLGNLQFSYVF